MSMSEQEVLKKLDIRDFGHITPQKFTAFVPMLDNMDSEVAEKLIGQIPEFTKTMSEALEGCKQAIEKASDQNAESTKRFYDICDEIISALKDFASQEDIPFEQKQYYIEKMKEIAQMANEKDSENKGFLTKLASYAAAALGVAVVAAAYFLGGGNDA